MRLGPIHGHKQTKRLVYNAIILHTISIEQIHHPPNQEVLRHFFASSNYARKAIVISTIRGKSNLM